MTVPIPVDGRRAPERARKRLVHDTYYADDAALRLL
jgi:hypothetical protein